VGKKQEKWDQQKWRRVIFSDESHFEVQGYRSQYVRRSKGEPLQGGHNDQASKDPAKKMFWGCFTFKGTGRLILVKGMMNSIKYKEILPNICFQPFELLLLKEVAFFNRIWRRATHQK